MEQIHLDRNAFVAWVEGHEPGEVIGRIQRSHDCPLRNYLFSTDPSRFAGCGLSWQGANAFLFYGTSAWARAEALLPAWCAHFMFQVDELLPELAPSRFLRKHVIRETALWLLNGAVPPLVIREETDDEA